MSLLQLVNHPAWIQLGLSLAHFLWQGAAIAMVLAVGLFVLRRRSPESRHVLCLGAMLMMALCPVATLAYLHANPPVGLAGAGMRGIERRPYKAEVSGEQTEQADRLASSRATGRKDLAAASVTTVQDDTAPESASADALTSFPLPQADSGESDTLSHGPEMILHGPQTTPQRPDMVLQGPHMTVQGPHAAPLNGVADLPAVASGAGAATAGAGFRVARLEWGLAIAALAWACGVGLLGLRFLFAWLRLGRFRRVTEPLPETIERVVDRLRRAMGIRGTVPVRASHRTFEPLAFGLLRPVVLVPASLLTQCPVEMLEAMIAHELAHIRRHDLWINLLQRVIETLLFYHPGVWWVSGRMRLERELCCDDLAVQATGRRADYADALVELSRTLHGWAAPILTTGMFTSRLSLPARVRRVLQVPSAAHDPNRGRYWMAGPLTLMVAGLMVLISSLHAGFAQDRRVVPPLTTTQPFVEAVSETTPRDFTPYAGVRRESPASFVPVRPLTDGIIAEVVVKPGQTVKKGELLVKLDDAEARIELESAMVRLEQTQREYKRSKELAGQHGISQQEAQKAETDVKLTELEVEKWKLRLGRTQIHSPADGVVEGLGEYLVGKPVTAGETIMYIRRGGGPARTTQSQPAGGAAAGVAQSASPAGALPLPPSIRILSPTAGTVAEVLVKPSQHVKKGEAMIRLDARDAELELRAAHIRLQSAQARLKQASEKYKQGKASQEEVVEAETAAALVDVEIARIQLQIEKATIRSPIDGVVAPESGYPQSLAGQPVATGQVLLYITPAPQTRPATQEGSH